MKAAIYYELGEADVLRYEEVPDPVVGPTDVLVEVKASSVNRLDLRLRSGQSPRPVKLPHVGGVDVAGVVKEVGTAVKEVEEGMRVVVNPTVKSYSPRSGDGPLGLNRVVGVNTWGGFAEYVVVPAENVVELPESVGFEEASTLPICFVTAWYAFTRRAGVRAGGWVLVHAAGSGTGSAALQMAKLMGARVIATAGSDEKLEKAHELGADATVNYSKDDVARRVGSITGGDGVDVVFDQIGGEMFDANLKVLAPGGTLLLVGVVGGLKVEVPIGPVIMRDVSVHGVTVFRAGSRELAEVVALMAQGRIRAVIDKVLPLEEAAEAQRMLEERRQFGKVVLRPR